MYYQNSDGSILPNELKKIFEYYGWGVPAILGEGFALLHNRQMTPEERSCTTALGALTGLFDDFIDNKNGDPKTLHSLIFHPEKTQPKSDFERLFQEFAKIALSNIPAREAFEKSIAAVMDMQQKTINQNNLNDEDLLALTIDKGGKSILFYTMAFAEKMTEQEATALYQLGGLMQMGNDLFDVYEDHTHSIETLFTREAEVQASREIITKQWRDALQLCRDLPYKNAEKFTDFMAFGLARCFVCLDQYELLARKSGGFYPEKYSREQLICDMEKPINLLKALKYFLRYN